MIQERESVRKMSGRDSENKIENQSEREASQEEVGAGVSSIHRCVVSFRERLEAHERMRGAGSLRERLEG